MINIYYPREPITTRCRKEDCKAGGAYVNQTIVSDGYAGGKLCLEHNIFCNKCKRVSYRQVYVPPEAWAMMIGQYHHDEAIPEIAPKELQKRAQQLTLGGLPNPKKV